MKKKYITPEIEILFTLDEDVITASIVGGNDKEGEDVYDDVIGGDGWV